MTIEKLEKNKIKIILTLDELKKYGVTITDIKQGNLAAKNFFMELIVDANLEPGFVVDGKELFIEASTMKSKLFVITITKVMNNGKPATPTKSMYYINSNIYTFSKEQFRSFIELIKEQDIYLGVNHLYKHNNKYLVFFTKSSIKNAKFLATFLLLSEYCDTYFSKPNLLSYLNEHATLICEGKSLQQQKESLSI